MKKLLLFLLFILSFISHSVLAQTGCSAALPWNSTKVYWANELVLYNGNLYKAKWYTHNQTPGDIYGPWGFLNPCSGSSGGTGTSCSSLQTWNSTNAYNTDTEIVYNTQKYRAKWYTQNQIPGDPFGPWELLGDCTSPLFSISSLSFSFNTSVGTPSIGQTFSISGSNLSSGINLAASAGFEISLTPNDGFTADITVAPTNGSLANRTVFVRYNPLSTGTHNGSVLVTSSGATAQTITLAGVANSFTYTVCNDLPVWSSNTVFVQGNETVFNGKKYRAKWYTQNQTPGTPNDPWEFQSTCVYSTYSVSGATNLFNVILGSPSVSQNISVSGNNLLSEIVVTAPSQFEISLNNSTFSNSISIAPVNSTVSSTTIYVRYNPSSVGNHSGQITVATTGLNKEYVAVSGTSSSPWIVNLSNIMHTNQSILKVGIGTNLVPTDYLLGVNGKIICKGLKVQFTGWADTVFQEGYKLPDLVELENFLKVNKHLPEIPSEKEVMENGMALEDLNVLLLKKIEELTLLLIEQNKKLTNAELEIQKIKNQKY